MKIFDHKQKLWVETFIFIPILYIFGWITVQLMLSVGIKLPPDKQDLIGTIISFSYFILYLPTWARTRWEITTPWNYFGISCSSGKLIALSFFKGTFIATGLLFLIFSILIQGSFCVWGGDFDSANILNTLLLLLGVGFAEELIFRGWLLSELNQLLGLWPSLLVQATIFSLAHIRFDTNLFHSLGLLVGLFLLGLILALRRLLDRGSIWGCIGLHGGLVGGWFFLTKSLIEVSPEAPSWLVGPGAMEPNPLGGLIGLLSLVVIFLIYLTAFARAPSPFRGALKASSRGETP